MPVVGDPAVADTQDVGGDEIDWLAGAGVSHESAGEMASEAYMRDDVVTHYQPLYHRHFEVRHRGEKTLGGLCGPGRPLRSTMRQCVVHEIRRDRACEQRRAAIDPEAVEGIDGLEQSGQALGRDVFRRNLLLRPGHGEREGIADRRGGRGAGEHDEGERYENAYGPVLHAIMPPRIAAASALPTLITGTSRPRRSILMQLLLSEFGPPTPKAADVLGIRVD